MKAVSRQRLQRLRCLLLDVDGVLTDGKLHFTSDGREFKSFDVRDGHGIKLAQRAGLLVGFISGRPSAATTRRATDLEVNILKQGPVNKAELLAEVQREHHLRPEEIAFVGDDLVDLPALRRAGLAVAVANAVPEVKAVAHRITRRRGGDGAVREVIEWLLKARGQWRKVTARHLVAWVAAFLVAGTAAAELTGLAEKFEVPDYDAAGRLRWKLVGDRGQLTTNGNILVVNARAELYESNRVTTVFTAPFCVYERAAGKVRTAQALRLERDDFIVTGIGGEWDTRGQRVLIHSNVQLVVRHLIREPQP